MGSVLQEATGDQRARSRLPLVSQRPLERDARRDPGARRDRCLLFACADAVRRVWDYPPDWRDLPAEALAALSLRQ